MVNVMDIVKVGRVFFKPDSGPDIEKVTVLTLGSHVGNVVQLVNRFDPKYFRIDCSKTRDWLIRAAEKHDDAKPETFRVTYRSWKENERKSLGYSFAGHRFRVSDDNRYVELLIRLHHEFSVEGIAKAIAELKNEHDGKYAKFADNFPIDLYTLEMCDQIEAEIETYAFTGEPQPRVFMDFHSRMRKDGKIEIEPFDPFVTDSDIILPMKYYKWEIRDKERKEIEADLKVKNPSQRLRKLKEMLEHPPKHAEHQSKEMILCKPH
ncbi:hypothetical protein C6499_14605 [Candidatus Poribacteria bacterium]|nr:MAG: hypothetical protein C6499_14605 [Candidatus Poribacteria bacterium]